MNYKKEIIEILQNINDEALLERVYTFLVRFVKNWGY